MKWCSAPLAAVFDAGWTTLTRPSRATGSGGVTVARNVKADVRCLFLSYLAGRSQHMTSVTPELLLVGQTSGVVLGSPTVIYEPEGAPNSSDPTRSGGLLSTTCPGERNVYLVRIPQKRR